MRQWKRLEYTRYSGVTSALSFLHRKLTLVSFFKTSSTCSLQHSLLSIMIDWRSFTTSSFVCGCTKKLPSCVSQFIGYSCLLFLRVLSKVCFLWKSVFWNNPEMLKPGLQLQNTVERVLHKWDLLWGQCIGKVLATLSRISHCEVEVFCISEVIEYGTERYRDSYVI